MKTRYAYTITWKGHTTKFYRGARSNRKESLRLKSVEARGRRREAVPTDDVSWADASKEADREIELAAQMAAVRRGREALEEASEKLAEAQRWAAWVHEALMETLWKAGLQCDCDRCVYGPCF